MDALDLSISDIRVGDTAVFSRIFTNEDVELFAKLSGDYNPLHVNNEYAETTQFKKRIVHGMLVGSLCSQLVGMYVPGKRCLYLKQNLSFRQPVFIGETILVSGVVTSKSESTRVLSLIISIRRDDTVVVEGEAVVQVL